MVLYLHFCPEAWSDAFSLDVALGLGAPLEGVRVELEVLPAAIPLEAQNFSVPEGGSRTLAPPLLHVTGPYFPTLPGLSLQVLEPPRHGALQEEDGPQARTLSAFSWREVEEQLIRYVHDGSETLTDTFVLMANASETDRQSHPVAFTVAVLPVNDQPPVLTTNTGLQDQNTCQNHLQALTSTYKAGIRTKAVKLPTFTPASEDHSLAPQTPAPCATAEQGPHSAGVEVEAQTWAGTSHGCTGSSAGTERACIY
ncbi:Chondroitin sulfate proteoglycan 4 [Saguinus oedipus]|uniref:Chondroitin sulfate proteoglycan 4 n=1 Tax=Saguinus oedipus TaxID=9490 RepID=A0ABQ9V2J7_SAGOE|nr:Chondroitin sulfate proteoglycan 4 [Saguinus oedipus]